MGKIQNHRETTIRKYYLGELFLHNTLVFSLVQTPGEQYHSS